MQIRRKAGEMADPPPVPTAVVSAGRGDKQAYGRVTQLVGGAGDRGAPGVAHSMDRNVPGHSIVESRHSRSSPACNASGRERGDAPDWSLTPPLSMVDQLTLERDSLLRDRAELHELARTATTDRDHLAAELERRESEIVSLRKVIAESAPAHSSLSQVIVSLEQRSLDLSCGTTDGGLMCQAPNKGGALTAGGMTHPTPSCHGDKVTNPSTETGVDSVAPRKGEELAPPPSGELALFLVFQYLSSLELLVVGGVSRQWRQVSRHSSLWKQVEIKDVMLPAQVVEAMAEWCTQTETLKLHGLCPVPAYSDEDLQSYIQRQRACLENGLAVFFQSSGHCLRRVYITECHVMVTERVLWLAGIYCPNLQELAYSSGEFPAIAEAIWSLSCGSPDIRALYFPPVDGRGKAGCFRDHCLYNMASGFPRLRCAAVGGPAITPEGVAQFMSDCHHLREVRLVHCFEINQSSMTVLLSATPPKLIALSFIHTPITPRAVTLLTGTWPHLRKVVVSLSFSDYFEDINDKKSIAEFKKIVERLNALRQQSRALQVMADYS